MKDFGSKGDLAFLSISELSHLIETGEADPSAVTSVFLNRANGEGRSLNCFIALCEETAISEASAAAHRARSKRRLGRLDGIPIAVKDNVDVAGIPTSNGFGGPPYRIPDKDFRSCSPLARRRGSHPGQAQHARGRSWLNKRQPSFRARDEPASSRALTGWVKWRIGSSGRCRTVLRGPWIRYRRVRSHTSILLWGCRIQAQLRRCKYAWRSSFELSS